MDLEGWGLPAWTYRDPDFFALEIARIFRPAWQIAGHESEPWTISARTSS
jgi:phenylpropionate dioxygenase-like ring-hydroxylating dioxygenase large terminal subunit